MASIGEIKQALQTGIHAAEQARATLASAGNHLDAAIRAVTQAAQGSSRQQEAATISGQLRRAKQEIETAAGVAGAAAEATRTFSRSL